MYVSSHVGYDGRLMSGKIALTMKKLKKIINISREADLHSFYRRLIAEGLFTEVNSQLYWNTKLCFKGNMRGNGTKSTRTIRTYDKTIRDLYEQNTAKSLVVVFQLLPYVNKRWNFLCPDVENQDYRKAFTVEKVAELVQGGTTKNFKSKINRIMVGDDFVFAVHKVGKDTMVSVNQNLYGWLEHMYQKPQLLDYSNVQKKNI